MKQYIVLILIVFNATAQVNLETVSSNITKTGSVYYVENAIVNITQAINPITEGAIVMRNGGMLRFGNGSSITIGELFKDGSGNIIYGADGKPKVKNRVIIIEESDAASLGTDNYNNGTARFLSGCNVTLQGVTWIQKTTIRSDFDIQSGATVKFYSSDFIGVTSNIPHFASSNVEMYGLKMDNRVTVNAIEFSNGGIPSVIKGLELINNHGTSTGRHLIFVNNPQTTYQLDNVSSRNVSLYNQGTGFILQLNNPLGNIKKTNDHANSPKGVLEVYRNLKIDAKFSDNTAAANVRLYIARKNSSITYTNDTSLNSSGEADIRLLQYISPYNVITTTEHNKYNIWLLNYDRNIYYKDFTLDYVEGLNGENKLSNIVLSTDSNITKTVSQAAAITGISVTHSTTNDTGTITISSEVSLCDLYDYLKYDKVNTNMSEPSAETTVAQATGGTLNIGNYKLVLQNGSRLIPCEKFEKIISNIASDIDNPTDNLRVALTDANGTYKLINLKNIQGANIKIEDHNTSTVLVEETNYTGDYAFVTNNNSTDISALVTKAGYSNWTADMDLTSADVFSFIVSQSDIAINVATIENQETELYLLRKLVQKAQAIQDALNQSNVPDITLDSVSQSATNATEQKQEEMEKLLQILLNKISTIREIEKP